MLPTIKFRGHLHRSSGQSASAVTVISIDQHYQQGDKFKAFCQAINEEYEKRNLIKLTIVETGYLKRHYLRLDKNYSSTEEADLAAIQLGETWIKEQLSSLYSLNVPVEILSWKEIIESQIGEEDKLFSDYLSKIENDYTSDSIFKNHVNTISNKYAEKLSVKYRSNGLENLDEACLKAARDYLLEESSIIFKLVHRGFNCQLYPGNRNAALRYISKKYFSETNPIPWVRYEIKYPSDVKEKKLNHAASFFFENTDISKQEIKNKITELLSSLVNEEKIYFLTEQLNQLEQNVRITHERDIK
ncbi:hypothetical protein [Rickettsiella endosymbiont of Dermanyssus gallinae]|uniref:hypothetical protein n=1 Tax=Rickettsiella endosymbiont of Dermanyssus gallinae TaxID=2856608 RepID=UPI001C529B05|nr:hypothetical protein [Rickettsiella endosymbiont of Dermanyssus gallinae]